MEDISVPAMVRGMADRSSHEPVEFRDAKGVLVATVSPSSSGEFQLHLPEALYDVRQGAAHSSRTVLPGGSYEVDLRTDRVLDFKITSQSLGQADVEIQVLAEGAGHHTFQLRSDNLVVNKPVKKEIDLTPGSVQKVVWHARLGSRLTPWVAVVLPDDNLSKKLEASGRATQLSQSSTAPRKRGFLQ
jgi:hypothetical protein